MQLPKNTISELDELKLIYFEILDGYSFDSETSLFIKHFSDRESHAILQKRIELYRYYLSEGVPHESELLKNAIENDEWSDAKEQKILELKYAISDNEKNLHNIIWQQRKVIENVIQNLKNELAEMLFERKHTLGRNIEDLVDEDVSDFVVYLSFYKDKELKTRVEKTYDDFQQWEISEINKLNKSLTAQYHRFSEENIKGISVLPMFLNKFSYSKDDVASFLNKPVSLLSHHQNYLFSLGVRNLNILNNAKGSPPDINLDAKIKDIVHWYDIQYSLNIGKKNQEE